MRIALLYPPPWKIRAPGEGAGASVVTGADGVPRDPDGPPAEYVEGDLDADFYQTPYGLFALGAQALRAGHQVKVMNLSAFPWTRVRGGARARSTPTSTACRAGRRTAAAWRSSRSEIKRLHPSAHVVVGGPHATPLAREMLAHHPDIDTVCIGESELTFLELRRPPRSGARATAGIAGTAYRAGDRVEVGPERRRIEDLDAPRVAARLLRHPHRDDLARLPLALHLLRRGDELGAGLPRAVGALRARRAREGGRARAREDDPDQGRHLHHQPEARPRAVPGHPRARAPVPLELRHARRRARRRAPARDAPRGLRAPEPRRRVGIAEDPRRHRQEDHPRRDHRVDARSRRSTASRSATT